MEFHSKANLFIGRCYEVMRLRREIDKLKQKMINLEDTTYNNMFGTPFLLKEIEKLNEEILNITELNDQLGFTRDEQNKLAIRAMETFI